VTNDAACDMTGVCPWVCVWMCRKPHRHRQHHIPLNSESSPFSRLMMKKVQHIQQQITDVLPLDWMFCSRDVYPLPGR